MKLLTLSLLIISTFAKDEGSDEHNRFNSSDSIVVNPPGENCHSCYFDICNTVFQLPFDDNFITNCSKLGENFIGIYDEFFGTSERCAGEYEEYLCTVYFEPIRGYYNNICENYDTVTDHDYNALGSTLETRFCNSYENYKILNNTDCVPDKWNNIPFYGGNLPGAINDIYHHFCASASFTKPISILFGLVVSGMFFLW